MIPNRFCAYLLGALGICLFLNAQNSRAGEILKFGTNDRGSLLYTVATGLGKVIAQASDFTVDVKPISGTQGAYAQLNSREVDFIPLSAVDSLLAYQGPGKFKSALR